MERPSKKKKVCSEISDVKQKTSSCEDVQEEDKFHQLFGFHTSDLTSWSRFVHLLSRPTDPASLACIRFCYGLLMMLDLMEERGLGSADYRWGDEEQCRFPLISSLRPLPLHWMLMLYGCMWIGAGGIMLGALFHVSCTMFLVPYWFLLLLDKSVWNNHSYLFGILAFLLLLSDAHHYWSLDGLFKSSIHNADVPLWNYTLLRGQVFLVYFLAGLKKLDVDWVSGYSMSDLASHWVFEPFKLLMTEEQVDYLVVHLGGLTIDLFVGFLLFFDKTRLMAIIICSAFHLMNSQLFSIGMFPWLMLATIPLFCYPKWPRAIFQTIPRAMRLLTPDNDDDTQPSPHCLYPKECAKSECVTEPGVKESVNKKTTPPTRASFYHQAAAVFSIVFLMWQIFLPYSHFITKGYNSWTQGLYGYSWDMMVHTRSIQHVRITFVDKDTGRQGYLNPDMWSATWRWGSHPDMMKQYARCIADNLRKHNINNVELYFDVWISLNKRFQQRTVDPRVDLITAEWSIFKSTPWMMPLLVDLSDWRSRLANIEDEIINSTGLLDVVFVADFPGLYLENYVHTDIGNASISVLQGQVIVELIPEEGSKSRPENFTLRQGQEMQIPAGQFHNVHTVSEGPSCYMYKFVNTTEVAFLEGLKEFELYLNNSTDKKVPPKFANDPHLDQYLNMLQEKEEEKQNSQQSFKDIALSFLRRKYTLYVRGVRLIKGALLTVFTNQSFHAYLQEMNLPPA